MYYTFNGILNILKIAFYAFFYAYALYLTFNTEKKTSEIINTIPHNCFEIATTNEKRPEYN